jgi:hypothetical protein
MNKHEPKFQVERGQIVPLVVLMLFMILAMVALLLDGGSLMLNRRTAQASADAGALAGAREICNDSPSATVIDTAENYALMNQAFSADASIAQGVVTVNTTVSNDSYFAKIFNQSTLTSGATASAGCFAPGSGSSVLPISWSCKAPVEGSDSTDCQVKLLDWDTEMKPLVTGSQNPVMIHDYGSMAAPIDFDEDYIPGFLYVIVDANKVNDDISTSCAPIGDMNCDLNSDGINEVFGGANRSWLDLDGGGGGAADMKSWITDGFDGTIMTHTWLAGQSGVDTSIYKTTQMYINTHPTYPVVLVPVFDGICDGNPEGNPICELALHDPVPGEENVVASNGVSNTYYHIAGFSAFYLTCIDDGGGNKCPGATAFLSLPGNEDLKNIKTIEGYFISGYPFDLDNPGTGGVDVGVRIVSLIN